jgi:hypothetical protein
MNFPVGPEDVKVVHGHAGRGLQVMCTCGCVNLNYPESLEPMWRCRNCGRILCQDFPRLVEKALARQPQEPAPAAGH